MAFFYFVFRKKHQRKLVLRVDRILSRIDKEPAKSRHDIHDNSAFYIFKTIINTKLTWGSAACGFQLNPKLC